MVTVKPDIVEQEVVDKIRDWMIRSLQGALDAYIKIPNRRWINEDSCHDLLDALKAKSRVVITGTVWADRLDDALFFAANIRFDDNPDKYNSYWQAIEEGR
jgi:hypothetical protein